MAIKRITDRRGIVRYQDTNTGRFTKLSAWSRQAYKTVDKAQFEQLKPREKQSIKANQRIRNNGKFIDKRQEKKIRDTLEKTGQSLQNNDIFKTFGKEAAENILKDTYTRWVNSDPKNQFNVEKEIIKALKQGIEFTFIHEGKKYFGMDALFKLNQVQAERTKKEQKKGTKSPISVYRIKEDSDGNLLIDDEDTEVVGS